MVSKMFASFCLVEVARMERVVHYRMKLLLLRRYLIAILRAVEAQGEVWNMEGATPQAVQRS
jgi:hypothetical protein